jgi:hypothetical protein
VPYIHEAVDRLVGADHHIGRFNDDICVFSLLEPQSLA